MKPYLEIQSTLFHTSKKRVTLVTRNRNFFGFSTTSLPENAENCRKACGSWHQLPQYCALSLPSHWSNQDKHMYLHFHTLWVVFSKKITDLRSFVVKFCLWYLRSFHKIFWTYVSNDFHILMISEVIHQKWCLSHRHWSN